MSEILNANIFFVITSIAVVVVTVLLIAVLVYVLHIVRNIKEMSDKLKEGSELLASDFKQLHNKLQGANLGWKSVLGFALGKFLTRRRKSSKRKDTETFEE